MAATSGQEQGEVGQEQGEVGQEMGEVWQEMDAGGGHSVSGGNYSRALGSLSWLKGSSKKKVKMPKKYIILGLFYSNMMSLSPEDPYKGHYKREIMFKDISCGPHYRFDWLRPF